MYKDHKIQGAAALFALFFIASAIIAYFDPKMRDAFYTFVFQGMPTMFAAIMLFVKPDGQTEKGVSSGNAPAPQDGADQK